MKMLSVLLLFSLASAQAASLYSERVKAADGSLRCCSSNYSACRERCLPKIAPEPYCVTGCQKKHCLTDASRCEDKTDSGKADLPTLETQAQPSTASSSKKSDMSLRYDGRLTGPGTIAFEAFNRGEQDQKLQIVGIVFGRERNVGNVTILKSTPTQNVIPSSPSVFSLTVSHAEFSQWSKTLDGLTIAFSFPNHSDDAKWEYVNLLTSQDVEQQRSGEFRVKGAFTNR